MAEKEAKKVDLLTDQDASANYTLTSSQIKNIRVALCIGKTAFIDNTSPLKKYRDVTSSETITFLHHDEDVVKPELLPKILRPLPQTTNNNNSYLSPMYTNSWHWQKRDQMKEILVTPHRNAKTGRYNTQVLLFGDPSNTYLASIRKIAVHPEDLITARALPVEMDSFKRQVKLFLQKNDGEYDLPSLVDKLDASQLKIYLDEMNPEHIREEVKKQITQSPNNGAYLEALALWIGRYLTETKRSTFFPCLLSAFQATDQHYYHEKMAKFNPVDCVYIVTEKLNCTAKSYFDHKHSALTGFDILTVLAQVVVNLAAVQQTCGAVLCNLSLSSLRCRTEEEGSNIYVRWNGKVLEIPASRVWQHTDWTECSLEWSGVRLVSLESQSLLEKKQLPFQYDLICFARSVRPYIDGLAESDTYKQILTAMTDSWLTCQLQGSSADGTNSQLMQLEQEVCRRRDTKACRQAFVGALDSERGTCENAIPSLQLDHFSLFVTEKSVPQELISIDLTLL